jgi:signal transduction histidine kinase
MSHEIRSPLNSVLGFAELLSSQDFGALSEKQVRYVTHIRTSGELLLSLVNDVLDLARVASGRMPVQLEPTPVDPIIKECVTQLQPLADAAGVKVQLSGSPNLVAQADPRRLGQILTNLVSNAIKFTRSGGSVTVTRAEHPQALLLSVQDTGVGIPADKLDFIFDEFAQLESDQSDAYQGTGLGLPISRKLAELMGGRMEVSSGIDLGTTFTLSLPHRGGG